MEPVGDTWVPYDKAVRALDRSYMRGWYAGVVVAGIVGGMLGFLVGVAWLG